MEDVNKRRLNFLSLFELGYGSYEFGSKTVRLYLTKLMSWSYRDRDRKNANSLFKRRFRKRRRRARLPEKKFDYRDTVWANFS